MTSVIVLKPAFTVLPESSHCGGSRPQGSVVSLENVDYYETGDTFLNFYDSNDEEIGCFSLDMISFVLNGEQAETFLTKLH